MNHFTQRSTSGFSMVELMIVMGCLGFLGLITILLIIAGYNFWM